ncbi:MAG: hypothetical protein WC428_01685 [Candidatus Paceibacterota bacterium]
MKNLQLNHTYLIRYSSQDTLLSITVLLITDKAYHLRWNNHINETQTWETKSHLESWYTLVEDISDFVIEKPQDLKFDITYKINEVKWHPYFLIEEMCKVCGGERQIHDEHTTSAYKTCPACNGSGKESKRVDILFE